MKSEQRTKTGTPLASIEHRGVRYSVVTGVDDMVELHANGVRAGTGRLKLRIESRAPLGGDEQSAEAIYAALQSALLERLSAAAAPALSTADSTMLRTMRLARAARGPWYVTKAAVEQYCAIREWNAKDDDAFARAEDELIELAIAIDDAGKSGKKTADGLLTFRGPRPLRLRLIVNTSELAKYEKPQLLEVKPDHEGREGRYSRSAPSRKHGGPSREARLTESGKCPSGGGPHLWMETKGFPATDGTKTCKRCGTRRMSRKRI